MLRMASARNRCQTREIDSLQYARKGSNLQLELPRLAQTGAAQKKAYIRDISYPPGIANVANNCYASGVLHLLVNPPTFATVIRRTAQFHEGSHQRSVRGNR